MGNCPRTQKNKYIKIKIKETKIKKGDRKPQPSTTLTDYGGYYSRNDKFKVKLLANVKIPRTNNITNELLAN